MKTQVQQGDALYITAPGGGFTSGNGYLIGTIGTGTIYGVAAYTVASGGTGVLYIRGIFTLAKTSTDVWTVGLLLYAIPGTGVISVTSTSNHAVGIAVAAAANPSSTGQVLLLPSAVL